MIAPVPAISAAVPMAHRAGPTAHGAPEGRRAATTLRRSVASEFIGVPIRNVTTRRYGSPSGQRAAGGDRGQRRELFAVQRGATDQGAVHIFLRDDVADVLGIHRASVEHPDGVGD